MTHADDTAVVEKSYEQAVAALERALSIFDRCSPEERAVLRKELAELRAMETKLTGGRVELVVFGEISTGKSALINALVGKYVADVNVRGGWTKDAWEVAWNSGYRLPGLASSEFVLIDTPGLNEVQGASRHQIAQEFAERADLILFVTDSDLNEAEYSALLNLAAVHKPMLVVLNKVDLYAAAEQQRLLDVLRGERLAQIVPPENIVVAAADPRPLEYIVEDPRGNQRSEWRKPAPMIEPLKARMLEIFHQEGLELLALNASMYAADKSDRITKLRMDYRHDRAQQTVWSFAALKSLAVALNPIPVVDIVGGSAVDATMVVTLGHIYGMEMNREHASQLVRSILKSAGWVMMGEIAVTAASATLKGLTFGFSTLLSALPQGAAAGYGSYIVGQAAKHYFAHGSSWGEGGPKSVVRDILRRTDKKSVLNHLKDEIRRKIQRNRHVDNKA